jgi:lipopolysaccharide export system permease protein
MPTLWRFLISEYLKVLTLCTLAFIALLVAMRLEEIAQFAALGASSTYLCRFIAYQLPYIIPIALPVAALISAQLLMRRMSANHELTALRASGFGLGSILMPILLTAGVLSIANFVVVSELSTHANLMKRVLRKELKSLNPLILLQSERLAHMKGIYAQSFGPGKAGECASDVVVCLFNHQKNCLNLLTAKSIASHDTHLHGQQVTFISPMAVHEQGFDQLLVENSEEITLPKPDLTQLLGNSGVKLEHDHLTLAQLLGRTHSLRQKLHTQEATAKSKQQLKRNIAYTQSEILRRISVAFAVCSFTLLGLSYGIQTSRVTKLRPLITVLALAAVYLTCFFAAKNLSAKSALTAGLYFAPHILLIACSLRTLRRIEQGGI